MGLYRMYLSQRRYFYLTIFIVILFGTSKGSHPLWDRCQTFFSEIPKEVNFLSRRKPLFMCTLPYKFVRLYIEGSLWDTFEKMLYWMYMGTTSQKEWWIMPGNFSKRFHFMWRTEPLLCGPSHINLWDISHRAICVWTLYGRILLTDMVAHIVAYFYLTTFLLLTRVMSSLGTFCMGPLLCFWTYVTFLIDCWCHEVGRSFVWDFIGNKPLLCGQIHLCVWRLYVMKEESLLCGRILLSHILFRTEGTSFMVYDRDLFVYGPSKGSHPLWDRCQTFLSEIPKEVNFLSRRKLHLCGGLYITRQKKSMRGCHCPS